MKLRIAERVPTYLLLSLVAIATSGCGADRTASDGPPREFVGEVVSVDSAPDRVSWRISCGPRESERFMTSVEQATFWYETEPEDPAAGQVKEISFDEWASERLQRLGPWVVRYEDDEVMSVTSFSAPSDHNPCATE